jgi:hypothetical protein
MSICSSTCFSEKSVVSRKKGLEKMTENRRFESENRGYTCGLYVFAVFSSRLNGREQGFVRPFHGKVREEE